MGRLLAVAALSLFGCGGAISYHGQGAGSTTSTWVCRNSALLKVTWRGETGSLTVKVDDDMLKETVFTKTYVPTGSDQTETKDLGVGNWAVTASRSGEWKGAYSVDVDCK